MIELWFDLTNYVQYIFQDTHSISCSEGWEHYLLITSIKK